MQLIIVPGNSPVHKEWSDKVKEEIGSLFTETRILRYLHWETGETLLNFDTELEKLVALTKGLTDYVIFAKSAGTILTMRTVNEGKLSPQKCIFLGVPITWAKQNNFPLEKWIKGFNKKTLIIQQEFDRTCSVEDLRSAISEFGITNSIINVVPGEDHDYSDWAYLRKEVSNF